MYGLLQVLSTSREITRLAYIKSWCDIKEDNVHSQSNMSFWRQVLPAKEQYVCRHILGWYALEFTSDRTDQTKIILG